MTVISTVVVLLALTIVMIGVIGRVALDDRMKGPVLTRSRDAATELDVPPSDNEVGGRSI